MTIRWMCGDIQAFSTFKTFPLVTCYVGLGVGCAVGNNKHFRLLGPALLVMACLIKVPDALEIWQSVTFPTTSGFSDWGAIGKHVTDIWMYMLFFAPFLVLVLSGPFAAMATIGARLGFLFNEIKPLHAYAINLGGAICGSLLFSALSFARFSPWQMLLLACVLLVPYLFTQGKAGRWSILPMAAAVAVAAWAPNYEYHSTISTQGKTFDDLPRAQSQTIWSPYQRLDVVEQRFVYSDNDHRSIVPLGWNVYSNRRGYQAAMDLMPSSFEKYKLPALSAYIGEYRRRHQFPFEIRQPGDCLIVGAGSGNDVNEALHAGATHVDAVDIDPAIIDIGRHLNPAHPYDDPRVTLICDDARHYFNTCRKKYDLIVFAHLDSMAAVGASVRVDNYVYTADSFRRAMTLLKPDGVMVIAFCTLKQWFTDRLYTTLKSVTGYAPVVINDARSQWFFPNTFFVAGKLAEENKIQVPPSQQAAFSVAQNYSPTGARVLTDDWPYLYVTPSNIDLPYMAVVLEIVLISLFAGRKVLFAKSTSRDWQLFFMGGAFLLLELQSISRLSLLFGSSWLTTAVVINAVLLMIFFANLIVIKLGSTLLPRTHLLFSVLLGSLVASYCLPIQSILENVPAAWLPITIVTTLPMFMAGIIFSSSFSTVQNPRRALGINLLGAVYGALLEYLSNYTGVNSLVLVSAILYLTAWYFANKAQAEKVS